jgi:hypothetical protein
MIKRYLKILGKILLVIFLAFLILLWRACFWYPYRIEKYINTELEKVDFSKISIPAEKEFDKYKVNGAFARIFLLGHNQTSESGNSPYKIYIGIDGKEGIHKIVYINRLEILSNKNKKHNIIKGNIFPIKLILKPSSVTKKTVWGLYILSEMIDLDFKNKEEIEIITEVEVVTEEKTETKEIRYKFIPVLEEGHTGLML